MPSHVPFSARWRSRADRMCWTSSGWPLGVACPLALEVTSGVAVLDGWRDAGVLHQCGREVGRRRNSSRLSMTMSGYLGWAVVRTTMHMMAYASFKAACRGCICWGYPNQNPQAMRHLNRRCADHSLNKLDRREDTVHCWRRLGDALFPDKRCHAMLSRPAIH